MPSKQALHLLSLADRGAILGGGKAGGMAEQGEGRAFQWAGRPGERVEPRCGIQILVSGLHGLDLGH